MTDADIEQIVRSVLSQIAPEADLEELDPDVDIHEELDIDSMDFLNFVIDLEAGDRPRRPGARLPAAPHVRGMCRLPAISRRTPLSRGARDLPLGERVSETGRARVCRGDRR